jgi:hypothetical protein
VELVADETGGFAGEFERASEVPLKVVVRNR